MEPAMRLVFCVSIFAAMSVFDTRAQSPAPIIVQAASPGAEASAVPTSAMQNSASVENAIKLLEQTKAKNGEILKRQEAALQQLDELQQAADQLKIFSKRG